MNLEYFEIIHSKELSYNFVTFDISAQSRGVYTCLEKPFKVYQKYFHSLYQQEYAMAEFKDLK